MSTDAPSPGSRTATDVAEGPVASGPESESDAPAPAADPAPGTFVAPPGSPAEEGSAPSAEPAEAGAQFTAPFHAAAAAKAEDDQPRSGEPKGQQAADAGDYGAQLKTARERMGVWPSDVAASLHLEEAVIRALESGEQGQLPSRVYARGYIRAYANLVGLDADALIADFDASPCPPEASAKPVIGASRKRPLADLPQRRAGVLLGAIVAAIVIALALTLWGIWRAFDWSFVTEEDAPAAAPWQEERPQSASAAAAQAQAAPATEAATENGAAASADLAPDEAATPAPAEAPPAEALTFAFKEGSWVEVRDRAGDLLHSAVSQADETVTVSGQPPFTIAIGYAAGVELRYKGEAVALGPHTRGNVARLVVH